MSKKKLELIEKLIKFVNFTYGQPRDSNGDNYALLTIGKKLAEIHRQEG